MADGELAAHRLRQSVLGANGAAAGGAALRPVIRASWSRLHRLGMDPGSAPEVAPLDASELERRRATSRLAPLIPHLREALRSAIEASGLLMVVTDPDGRVLWREGGSDVRRLADRLGFVGGSSWTEGNVGTNAIGTCLVLGTPVRIHGAEHYVDSHTRWGCAAAPLHDPWTGGTLGVVDVSGPTRLMHPSSIAMVQLAARVAELELRHERQTELERLRAHASPLLARQSGRALAVDRHGHLAAAVGLTAPDRVALPDGMGVGEVWLPTLGSAVVEALPGGWFLRLASSAPTDPAERSVCMKLDVSRGTPVLSMAGQASSWTHSPTPRHTEILLSLFEHRAGRSAAELAQDLFADPTRVVTVRAEMSRLRRILGPLLCPRPYRIDEGVSTVLALPEDRSKLLASSSAPVVAALRGS